MLVRNWSRLFVQSTPSYRADIDGLRCVAVLAVLVYHAFPQRLPGGFAGVDVFFVISGYLITGILLGMIDRPGSVIFEFYRRRIRRIFPALIVVLLAVGTIGFARLLAPDYAVLGKHIAAGAGFVSNLAFWSEASYFDQSAATKPLLHLWSLGVEEQFYIFWPAMLIGLHRLRRDLLLPIVLIGVASFAYSAIAAYASPVAAFYSPISRFWELLAGAGLVAAERRGLKLPRWTSAAGAGLVLASFAVIDAAKPFPGLAALPVVAGTFLIIAAGPQAFLNRTGLSLRPAVTIGLFSYPLYLWHWPLLSFALIENFEEPLNGWVRLGLLAVAFALAWATWRFIERPPLLRRRYTPANLGSAMAVVLLAGLVVFWTEGIPGRPVDHNQRKQFIAYYQRMHLSEQTARDYRADCDFVRWGTLREKTAIDPSCTARTPRPYVLLWGDSHAQALSLGLTETLGTMLHQIATSGCRPDDRFNKLYYPNQALKGACDRSNRFALATIRAQQPDLLIIAQGEDHLDQQWDRFAAHLKQLGAKNIVLVGPLPQWRPSLAQVITAKHWPYRGERVADGLDPKILASDRTLRAQSPNWHNLTYASIIADMCDRRGCVAQLPGERVGSLTAMDYGHLTAGGSRLVAAEISPSLSLSLSPVHLPDR